MPLAPIKTRAAGFVAKAMCNTAPERRAALLVQMLTLCASGLRVIRGPEAAAETLYQLADQMAARGE